jgi:hypothetical protein
LEKNSLDSFSLPPPLYLAVLFLVDISKENHKVVCEPKSYEKSCIPKKAIEIVCVLICVRWCLRVAYLVDQLNQWVLGMT